MGNIEVWTLVVIHDADRVPLPAVSLYRSEDDALDALADNFDELVGVDKAEYIDTLAQSGVRAFIESHDVPVYSRL